MDNRMLEGKVALISGAARGQGAAEARLFAASGAQVVIGDILDEQGQALAESLGDAARYVHLDVTREADWAATVEVATTAFGKLDILVNNAGVLHFARIGQTTLEDFERVVRINQVGTFLGMRAVIPALKQAGGGAIVNISSTAAFEGMTGTVAYTASKWAVRGMTKTVAMEVGRDNIRVNSVHPGGMNTPMVQAPDGSVETQYYKHLALPRIGEPEEVARMVRFIASDECSYTTGSEFIIDGGMIQGVATDLVS